MSKDIESFGSIEPRAPVANTRVIDPKYSDVIHGVDKWAEVHRIPFHQRLIERVILVGSPLLTLGLLALAASNYSENPRVAVLYGVAAAFSIFGGGIAIHGIFERRREERDARLFSERMTTEMLDRDEEDFRVNFPRNPV